MIQVTIFFWITAVFPYFFLKNVFIYFLSFKKNQSQMFSGCDDVWQHDEGNHGPSRWTFKSKHWTLCLTEEYTAGIDTQCISKWYSGTHTTFYMPYNVHCSKFSPKLNPGLYCDKILLSFSGNDADNWCTIHLCASCWLIGGSPWPGFYPLATSLYPKNSERNVSALQGQNI